MWLMPTRIHRTIHYSIFSLLCPESKRGFGKPVNRREWEHERLVFLFQASTESITDVDAEEATDRAPEYGSKRKCFTAPEYRNISSQDAPNKEEKKNELFGHTLLPNEVSEVTGFIAE